MLAGFIIVPVVSLLTKAPEKSFVEHVFSCYDRTVTVSVKDSIGDSAVAENAEAGTAESGGN